MPEDVQAALERFRSFLDPFGLDTLIDAKSGFSVNDAQLLIGEIEMAAHERRRDERND
jgi:hypothetical protein